MTANLFVLFVENGALFFLIGALFFLYWLLRQKKRELRKLKDGSEDYKAKIRELKSKIEEYKTKLENRDKYLNKMWSGDSVPIKKGDDVRFLSMTKSYLTHYERVIFDDIESEEKTIDEIYKGTEVLENKYAIKVLLEQLEEKGFVKKRQGPNGENLFVARV